MATYSSMIAWEIPWTEGGTAESQGRLMFIVGTTKQLSKITYILYTYPEGFKKTTKKKHKNVHTLSLWTMVQQVRDGTWTLMFLKHLTGDHVTQP